MNLRKQPSHIIKIYEALGCVGDGRLELLPLSDSDNIITAKVWSSSRDK